MSADSLTSLAERCRSEHNRSAEVIGCVLRGLITQEGLVDADDLSELLSSLKNDLSLTEENLSALITDQTNQIIETIGLDGEGVLEEIRSEAENMMSQAAAATENAIFAVRAESTETMRSITAKSDEVMGNIVGYVSGAVNDTADLAQKAIQSIEASLENSVGLTTLLVESVKDDFAEAHNQTLEHNRLVRDNIINETKALFNSAVGSVSLLAESYIDDIKWLVSGSMGEIETLAADTQAGLGSGFENLDELYTLLKDKIGALLDNVAEPLSAIVNTNTSSGEPVFAALGNNSNTFLGTALNEDNKKTIDKMKEEGGSMWDDFLKDIRAQGFKLISGLVGGGETDIAGGFFQLLIQAASSIFSMIQAAQAMNEPSTKMILKKVNTENPQTVAAPSELMALLASGLLSPESFSVKMAQHGFEAADIEAFKTRSPRQLEPSTAMQAANRGFIDQTGFWRMMKLNGFEDTSIAALDRLRSYQPPVQDIITIAQRDAFSQDAIDTFGLDQELPEEYVSEAGKSGLSRYWAEKYWAAHWRLPSLQMGYEMYHKEIITQDELNELMKTQDIVPLWREKLMENAHRAITAVDIRRMYQLGVMDLEEVTRRYTKRGYSPEDAAYLAQFTASLYPEVESGEDLDVRDVSVSQIRSLFTMGSFTREEALEALKALGYTANASLALVRVWKDNDLIKQRAGLITRVIRKVVRDDLPDDEAASLLRGLGATEAETERALNVIAIERRDPDNIPSKTELKNMAKAGIISRETLENSLTLHGYNNTWIQRYIALWRLYE